jgi:hypothetical protein
MEMRIAFRGEEKSAEWWTHLHLFPIHTHLRTSPVSVHDVTVHEYRAEVRPTGFLMWTGSKPAGISPREFLTGSRMRAQEVFASSLAGALLRLAKTFLNHRHPIMESVTEATFDDSARDPLSY